MYSLEHEAQPEVFSNAFSGIWWAASTLLTVGYGDIYPITPLGKLFGICITFLGVGMVAIPTGIISAGFVEQYTQFALLGDSRRDETLRFVSIELTPEDSWTNKAIRELKLPAGLLIAIVRRGKDSIVPNGDLVLEAGDIVVLGAEPLPGTDDMELKEMTISSKHKWKDQAIRDLDISRQAFIVMVKRGDKKIVPRGSTVLQEGDSVYMYKKA
jgi:voltage-gated potassium channel